MPEDKRRKKGGKTSVGQYNKHCGCGWDGKATDYAAHRKEKHGTKTAPWHKAIAEAALVYYYALNAMASRYAR